MASQLPDSSHDAWPRPVYAWYVVGVLSLAYTFSIIDRQILALLVQPIRRDLGISDTQVAILGGFAFAILYTFLSVPIGWLADRKSRRLIIAFGVFFWSLATASCGLAKNFWQLFMARVGVGIGEATLSPSASSLIADYFPPEKLSRAMSVFMLGAQIGGGLAFIGGGAVIALVAATPEVVLPFFGTIYSWQLAFIFVGLPGLLVVAIIWTVREPKRRGLLVRKNAETGSQEHAIPLRQVALYLAQGWRTYLPHLLGFAVFGIVVNGIIIWLPTTFIRTYGWSASEAGFTFGGLLLVFGALGTLSGGWLSDRLRAKGHLDAPVRTALFTMLVLTPIAVLMPLMPTADLAVALLVPTTFLIGFPLALAPAALMLITPNQMRAQISAVFVFAVNLVGMGMGPLVVALITDYGFGDDMAIRYSLSIAVGFAAPLAALAFYLELAPFRASAEASQAWRDASGETEFQSAPGS